jgi:hypothetical protein
MTVAYRASGAFVDTSGTSSGSIGLPAGLTNGDVLVLLCQSRGTGNTVATPSGYTLAATYNQTNSHRFTVFYRYVANAGAEAAPSVTQTVSGAIRARLSAFSGCDSTTPLDVAATFDRSTDALTVTAPDIAPVSQGAMAIWCFSTGDDNTLNAATQGTTAYSSDGTAGGDGSIALVYELQTNAGSAGSTSMTESVNGPDNWVTISIALRNAAVAAANPSRTLGYDGVTYAVEAAFGASPFAPNPTWTDISAYVRAEDGVTVNRGRSSEFSDVQPGTMSLTLDNRTRLFDPDYSAGTYFGQLLPQTRIRLRVRFSSTNYPIFDGYVTGWPQSYVYPREAVVQLQAYDLLSRLGTRRLPPTMLALQILTDSPVAYFPMLEDNLPACSDLSGNGWAAKYSETVEVVDSPVKGEPSFKAKRILETDRGENTIINATGPDIDLAYSVEAWFRVDSLVTTFTEALGNIDNLVWGIRSTNAFVGLSAGSYDDDGAIIGITASLLDATNVTAATIQIPFSLRVTHQLVSVLDAGASTWTLYLDGASIGSASVSAFTFEGGTSPAGIFVGTDDTCDVTVAHLAVYDSELTAARVLAHYHAGISGGRQDTVGARLDAIADYAGLVDAGLYSGTNLTPNTYLGRADLSGSVLSVMQSAMTTDQGRLFVNSAGVLAPQGRTADMADLAVNFTSNGTLADSGSLAYSEVPIDSNNVDLIRNAIYVSIDGATISVTDDASITQFDEQEESITAELDQPHDARNLGLSRLRRFADPTSRIPSVQLRPRSATDARYPIVFGVELGWRFVVQRTPQGIGSAISKNVTVEGITHTIDGAQWITDLYLAPAVTSYTEQPWFIVGDAVYGEIGLSDGNQIPY